MVGDVDQLQLLVVDDRVGIDAGWNLFQKLVIGERENAGRIGRSLTGEREVAIRYECDSVNVRQTFDRGEAAIRRRIYDSDEVVAGESDVEPIAIDRHVVDKRAGESEWGGNIDRTERTQSF
jgi:hypothetical protein